MSSILSTYPPFSRFPDILAPEVSDHMSAINPNKLVEEYTVPLASPSTLT